MRRALDGDKRREAMTVQEIQQGNSTWWNSRPMDYDWDDENGAARGSPEWFARLDHTFIESSRLFATDVQPFDRMIPLQELAGRRVLEIGCGMGLHTELMSRAGARVTAVDLTPAAIEMTRRRLELKSLSAELVQVDAEKLPFPENSFDFVWSWGVIHHSARTGRIVRNISRVLAPNGECRVMVYNRASASAMASVLREHVLRGGFLRQSFEESLFRTTDGFSARFYVREQFEDLFRTFFEHVESEICGLDVDVLPLPKRLRSTALALLPEAYQREAQARRGGFIFLKAREPV